MPNFNIITDDIPLSLQKTKSGCEFLRCDSGCGDTNRIIVFYSEFARFYIQKTSFFNRWHL
jgi:hypothetical protein